MPYIILDRDGVINYNSPNYIKSPAEWNPIPGSLEAIAALTRAGFKIVIASNQSGIARGLFDLKMLASIHKKLYDVVADAGGKIEAIFFCPHHPDDHCACRKPKAGLLYQIRDHYQLNLSQTYFVGDTLADIKAARLSGCLPILVLSGNNQESLKKHHAELKDVPQFANLAAAVDFILANLHHQEIK